MLAALDNQIVTMYDDLGASPEEIVDSLQGEYDLEAVKMCLLNHSPKYKFDAKQSVSAANGHAPEAQGIFDDDERQLARQVAIRLLRTAESEAVQGRMVEVILQEQRAERTSQKLTALANVKTTIAVMQEHMSKAKAAVQRARQATIIDVAPQTQLLEKAS
jgi:hypothetical protein